MIANGLNKKLHHTMKNFYYMIWADSILRFQKYHPERKDWKIAIFILNTWINALNFWIIFLWLKFLIF